MSAWSPCCCCLAVLALALLPAGAAIAADEKDDPIVAYARSQLKETGKPFTLVVIVKVKEGEGDRFEKEFARALTATRKEKGCITYDLNRDSKDPQRYVVYERWKTLADLEAHLKTAHIKALREVLPDVLTGGPELHILLPSSE